MNIDIVAIQEPVLINNCSIASREWISVYPMTHANNPKKTRSLTLI